jgi:hypothetical protein
MALTTAGYPCFVPAKPEELLVLTASKTKIDKAKADAAKGLVDPETDVNPFEDSIGYYDGKAGTPRRRFCSLMLQFSRFCGSSMGINAFDRRRSIRFRQFCGPF